MNQLLKLIFKSSITPGQPTSNNKLPIQSIENADTLDLIWYEDFRERS